MTPILRGHASRLGLRKPPPTLVVEISVDMAALNRSFEGLREFMAHNDAKVRAAFVGLSARLRAEARARR